MKNLFIILFTFCSLPICATPYSSEQISRMIYDEYLLSLEFVGNMDKDDDFYMYQLGRSSAYLGLFYKINCIESQ